MTRPNPTRDDHDSLKVLEGLAATEEAVAAPPGIPGPLPATTDVHWVTLDENGDLLYHMAEDNRLPYVNLPMWTSFALPDPADPGLVVYPMLEE